MTGTAEVDVDGGSDVDGSSDGQTVGGGDDAAVPLPVGDFVTPADIGTTVGPTSAPGEVITGDVSLDKPGEVLADVTINGCVTVNADDVTLRNVTINCTEAGYPIKTNGTARFTIERSKIDCGGTTNKGMYFELSSDFTVDGVEITGCDDQLFIDGGLGDSTIKNSIFHNQAPAGDAHTDGMQLGQFEVTTGTLIVEGNWWEYNREGCCENAVLFATGHSELTVHVNTNYLDSDFGTHIIRCTSGSTCLVRNNTLAGEPDGLFFYAGESTSSSASCNVLLDGSPVPGHWYDALIAVDDSDCPYGEPDRSVR